MITFIAFVVGGVVGFVAGYLICKNNKDKVATVAAVVTDITKK